MTHQERIASFRTTIATDEQTIAELRIKRTALLATDDDSEIGKIDTEIERLHRRIGLSQERIAATEQAERDAAQQAYEQHLDALAAKAEKARGIGTGLLQDYAKHAASIAAVLSKLSALDALITESNRTLAAAGRSPIASPNAARCRPVTYVERTERRRVGIGEEAHPLYAVATWDLNGMFRHRETQEPIAPFGEFDVPVRELVPMVMQEPLQDDVRLPSSTIDSSPIWPRPIDHAAILRSFDLGEVSQANPLKRLFAKATT